MSSAKRDVIGVFDLSGFQHWAWALKEKNGGSDRDAFLAIRTKIMGLVKEYKVDKAVIAVDVKPTYRLKMVTVYKAGRKSKGVEFSAWRTKYKFKLCK